MVRAIARCALVEAARLGHYHASFHGFRVDALRQSHSTSSDVSEVSFLVSQRAMLIERGVAVVRDDAAVMPSRSGRECFTDASPEDGTNLWSVGHVD